MFTVLESRVDFQVQKTASGLAVVAAVCWGWHSPSRVLDHQHGCRQSSPVHFVYWL